jgi:hypothetical protein
LASVIFEKSRFIKKHPVSCQLVGVWRWRTRPPEAIALLALRQIDLDKSVLQAGHKVRQVQMKTWQGKMLKEVSLGVLEARVGGSVVTINRSRLVFFPQPAIAT